MGQPAAASVYWRGRIVSERSPSRFGPAGRDPFDPCPTDAELAAFSEGKLGPPRPEEVARHVLHCAECQDVIGSLAYRHAESLAASSRAAFPRRAAIAAGLLLAVLAASGGVWRLSRGRTSTGIADLVRAVGQRRLVEARLSGGFAWAPVTEVRGEGGPAGTGALDPARSEIAGAAARIRGGKMWNDPTGDMHSLGVAYLVLGNVDEAVTALDAAAKASPDDAAVLSDLAAACIEKGKAPDQAQQLVRALDLSEKAIARAPAFVEARFNKALALEALGLRDAAIEAWESYVKADPSSPWSNEARSRLAKLRSASRLERWEDSAQAFQSACSAGDARRIEEIVRAHPQQSSEALMTDLGRWADLALTGQPSAGATLRAVESGSAVMARVVGDPIVKDAVAEIRRSAADRERLSLLAAAHRQLRLGRAAEDAMQANDGKRLLTDASDRFAKLKSSYRDLALLYELSSEYYIDPAGAFTPRLEALIERYPAGEKRIVGARARWLMGLALGVSGRTSQALTSLAEAGEGLRALGFTADAVFVRSIEANTWWMLGRSGRAWTLHRDVFRQLDAVTDARLVQALIGATAKEAELDGQQLAALSIGQAALAMSKRHNSAFDRCDGLAWFASAAARAGRTAAAGDAVHEARGLLPQVSDPSTHARLDGLLGLAEARLSLDVNPDDALRAADRSVAWLESVDKENLLAEAYELRAKAKEKSGDLDSAAKDYLSALQTVEHQRDRLRDVSLRTSFVDTAWELGRDVVRFEIDRGDPRGALAMADRLRATSVAPPMKLSPEEARDPVDALVHQLGPDDAVIFYEILEHRTIAWVLRAGRVQSAVLPIEERAIDLFVDAIRREMTPGDSGADEGGGRKLFEQVVGPLRGRLEGAQRIIIVPDGRLHSIPWGALQQAPSGRRWIEDASVAVAPSLRCLIGRRVGAGEPADFRVVAVGNPAFDRLAFPGLPDLPAAANEAREIGALYARSSVLVGSDAIPDRFLAEIASAEVLHVAAHAIPSGVDPDRSTVVLAPGGTIASDGGLTAGEIRGHDLRRVRLAVLAACRSGDGPLSRIEGPLSLARPLLEDGARNVVVSLWDLPDEAGASVMVALHRALRDGADPIDALRRAQLECWSAPNPDPRACGGLQLIVNEPGGGRR